MAFVNEYISDEDVKKYDLEAIDRRNIVGGTSARDWTFDRERDIYLRNVGRRGRDQEVSHQLIWNLYWNRELIEVAIDLVGSTGGIGEHCSAHWRIRHINFPTQLRDQRDEILASLREALLAYKDGGVFSRSTSFSMTLDDK